MNSSSTICKPDYQIVASLFAYLFLYSFLFFGCTSGTDYQAPRKSVEQYVADLVTDPSYLALQNGVDLLTKEAKASSVIINPISVDDVKMLNTLQGAEEMKLLNKLTNNPQFILYAERVAAKLVADFVLSHKDLAGEDSLLIDQVYLKLRNLRMEAIVNKLKLSKSPDCAGQCNQAYGTGMQYCAASYTVAIAALIITTGASGPAAVATAAGGFIVAELGRGLCESNALDTLSICHTACGME